MPKIFPMSQYAKISQYLHLNDKRKELPRGHADHNKLFSVRPLLDLVVGTLEIDWAVILMTNPSHTIMKTVTACEQTLHLRDIKRCHIGDTGARWKWELTLMFACHWKWRVWHLLVVMRIHYSVSQILKKILAIYILSTMHNSSISSFSLISTNP